MHNLMSPKEIQDEFDHMAPEIWDKLLMSLPIGYQVTAIYITPRVFRTRIRDTFFGDLGYYVGENLTVQAQTPHSWDPVRVIHLRWHKGRQRWIKREG